MFRTLMICLSLSMIGPRLLAGPIYNATNLGDLPVTKINNAGVAIGFSDPTGYLGSPSSFNKTGDPQGFTFNSHTGVVTPYSPLSVESPYAIPTDINDAGQVVGRVTSGNPANAHAFLVQGGVTQDLGPDIVRGINTSGQMLRAHVDSTGTASYYVQWNGVNTPIVAPGFTPQGITSAGAVVGSVGGNQPAVWQNGHLSQYMSLPSTTSSLTNLSINASGQIIGTANSASTQSSQGFISALGTSITTLTGTGGEGFSPHAINAFGQVVGNFAGSNRAAFYANGKFSNLNDLVDPSLGWTLVDALSINDAGQILAKAVGASDPLKHANFLLTPLGSAVPVSPVPEPGTVVLFSLIGTGLVFWRRRGA